MADDPVQPAQPGGPAGEQPPGYPPQPPGYPTRPPGYPPGYLPGYPQNHPQNYPPGYPQGGVPQQPPSPSTAMTSLILGIVGLVMCGLLTSIPAIFVGRSALREIDNSGGRLGGRSTAQAGYVLGIVGTVIWGLLIAFLIVTFAVGVAFFDNVDCVFTDTSDEFSVQCD